MWLGLSELILNQVPRLIYPSFAKHALRQVFLLQVIHTSEVAVKLIKTLIWIINKCTYRDSFLPYFYIVLFRIATAQKSLSSLHYLESRAILLIDSTDSYILLYVDKIARHSLPTHLIPNSPWTHAGQFYCLTHTLSMSLGSLKLRQPLPRK